MVITDKRVISLCTPVDVCARVCGCVLAGKLGGANGGKGPQKDQREVKVLFSEIQVEKLGCSSWQSQQPCMGPSS